MNKGVHNVFALIAMLFLSASSYALEVKLYVDAAPNNYGSSDYAPWEAATYAAVANGTFVNMSNGTNPANDGSTNFEITDEVVYSFGDLGKRLTWIYWVPQTTINDLTAAGFQISLFNYWGSDPAWDFYDYYYGDTWLTPSSWIEYGNGVIGTAGMAWWGAYNTNAQAELDADLEAWGSVSEDWVFSVRVGTQGPTTSITSHRDAIPEPGTLALVGLALAGLGAIRGRRNQV